MNAQGQLTRDDIPDYAPATVNLPNGWSAKIAVERDDDMQAPWDEHDGHGPVGDWQSADAMPEDEADGEWIVARDRHMVMVYDHREALKIAIRDGWGCGDDNHGHRGLQAAACAVSRDFNYLRAWANDEWEYVGVTVTLFDAEGEQVEQESVWGVESLNGYWRNVAVELINDMATGVVLPNAVANGGGQS